jgi:HEAT repeat protein
VPAAERRREVALAGHLGDADTARRGLTDPDPQVRATALAAADRTGRLGSAELTAALHDPEPQVRARACELAATRPDTAEALIGRLADDDATVVEVAAWAVGELSERTTLPPAVVDDLSRIATGHEDPLAREAATAALGAIGDERGLPAILRATTDKPAIRRRAVLALAPFEGAEVDAALARASNDRDWQVQEAARLVRDEGR